MAITDTSEPVWSVSEVNAAVRDLVENSLMPFWISGEVGTMNIYQSGHVYLTLKDAKCQIRAVYFGGAAAARAAKLAVGDTIEALGKLTVYPVRGEYQFSIRELRTTGTGDLERSFALLKKKLSAEGLFAPEKKRLLPFFPERIGIVTSPDGAAVRDFLNVFFRRRPGGHIRIYPSPVQGEGAGAKLAAGVEYFSNSGWAQVIVVTRGGGSMEDLWCFNDENLARTIAASKVPVVSAVGHEIDFTIADFAADLRAATPSAAAELLGPESANLLQNISDYSRRAANIMNMTIQACSSRLEQLASSYVFREVDHTIEGYVRNVDDLALRLDRSGTTLMDRAVQRLESAAGKLHVLDPDAVLARGYMMMVDPQSGIPVTCAADVPWERPLTGRFADGEVTLKRHPDPAGQSSSVAE